MNVRFEAVPPLNIDFLAAHPAQPMLADYAAPWASPGHVFHFFLREETMTDHPSQEPSDPVERADARRAREQDGDVEVTPGGVKQRPHGNMDATLIPKGKDHLEEGPYEPVHDKVVPDTDPDTPLPGKQSRGR